jgi:hypothetical protein
MDVRRRRARAGLLQAARRAPALFRHAGVDPEEVLATSLAARHMLFFLDLARRTRAFLMV